MTTYRIMCALGLVASLSMLAIPVGIAWAPPSQAGLWWLPWVVSVAATLVATMAVVGLVDLWRRP